MRLSRQRTRVAFLERVGERFERSQRRRERALLRLGEVCERIGE